MALKLDSKLSTLAVKKVTESHSMDLTNYQLVETRGEPREETTEEYNETSTMKHRFSQSKLLQILLIELQFPK